MTMEEDGTLSFTVPDAETPPEPLAIDPAGYPSGAAIRAEVMAWGRDHGADEADGF